MPQESLTMTQNEQQTAQPATAEEQQPLAQLPELPEEDDDHSVFPHFWLCLPIALVMCWQFYDLFGGRLFFYRAGAGGYGTADIIGPAWVLMPLLFVALLFFAFWNMRFARESGDTKAQSLWRGLWTMCAAFLVAALIVWLLIQNMNWKEPV
jgi:hypothetical protein